MNIQYEIWRPVVGYEGLYEVSNLGRVKSCARIVIRGIRVCHLKERFLTGDAGEYGHLRVTLYKNGISERKLIHRLVAEAFIPNPLNLPFINHKDNNPSNNEVGNIEWCDCEYNNRYGGKPERISDTLKKPVSQYTKNGTLVRTLKGAIDFTEYGFNPKLISAVCLGKQKTHNGYIFKFSDTKCFN